MCFSLSWLLQILIWIVVICAVVAIVRLVLPIVLGWLGVAGGIVMQGLNIVLIAFVIIVVLIFAFDLISCVGGIGMRR